MTESSDFAKRGSQRWLQQAVNRSPETLNAPLRESLRLPEGQTIDWLSPLVDDGFVEYRDSAALEKCGITLSKRSLGDFWPQRGPVWDGLARTGRGDLLFVEAKAHIPELVSPRSKATEPARGRIAKSMKEVQASLTPASSGDVDWTGTFYQFANRVAHLHFLREQNNIKAHMVGVYFINAKDVKGPTCQAEWEGALKVVECYLGLGRHRLSKYMHKVFVDVSTLA